MFNDVLTLVAYAVEPDELGNQTKRATVLREVLCSVRSLTRYEYYNHGEADRRPEFVVTMNKWDYEGEVECDLGGVRYTIVRTYDADRDLIELTLERRTGNEGFHD